MYQINHCHNCSCGKAFSVQHALSCPKGGFPTFCHNKIRHLTASLLTEVCSYVAVKPSLQQLSGEELSGASANRDEGARMDLAADGFQGHATEGREPSSTFRVFNLHAPLQQTVHRYQQHTRSTNRRKNASTFNAFAMLSTVYSPHCFSHLLVKCLGWPETFTNVLPPCWPKVGPALQHHNGSATIYPVLLAIQIFHSLSSWLSFIPWPRHKIWKLHASGCSPVGRVTCLWQGNCSQHIVFPLLSTHLFICSYIYTY